jgi:hypothetical protein
MWWVGGGVVRDACAHRWDINEGVEDVLSTLCDDASTTT